MSSTTITISEYPKRTIAYHDQQYAVANPNHLYLDIFDQKHRKVAIPEYVPLLLNPRMEKDNFNWLMSHLANHLEMMFRILAECNSPDPLLDLEATTYLYVSAFGDSQLDTRVGIGAVDMLRIQEHFLETIDANTLDSVLWNFHTAMPQVTEKLLKVLKRIPPLDLREASIVVSAQNNPAMYLQICYTKKAVMEALQL